MAIAQVTKDKEMLLWLKYKKSGFTDNIALSELLRLQHAIIVSSANKYNNPNIPTSAIEAEARSLAIQAYKTYDPKHKTQLNTHVYNYMQKLYRYVSSNANIASIPEHRISIINNYQKELQHYKDSHGEFEEPTNLYMSKKLKVAPSEISYLKTELRKDLGYSTGSGEDLLGNSYLQPDYLKESVMFLRLELDSPDREVLEYKFGLLGKPILTDQEIMLKLRMNNYQLKKILANISEKLRGQV